MAKQEEVWEGIHKHIKDTLIVCGQNPITAEALALDTTQDIWQGLHSQGVVIKVERKEPISCRHAQMAAARYSRDVTCPLIEAGCGFFEPLIKEV